MRYIWILLILVVLGSSVYGWFYWQNFQRIETFTKDCKSASSDMQSFILALKNQDKSLCDGLPIVLKSRCQAFLVSDAGLCDSADYDCIAISSKNVSACFDDSCRALASGDVSYCDSLDGDLRTACIARFNLDSAFFGISDEQCRVAAEELA